MKKYVIILFLIMFILFPVKIKAKDVTRDSSITFKKNFAEGVQQPGYIDFELIIDTDSIIDKRSIDPWAETNYCEKDSNGNILNIEQCILFERAGQYNANYDTVNHQYKITFRSYPWEWNNDYINIGKLTYRTYGHIRFILKENSDGVFYTHCLAVLHDEIGSVSAITPEAFGSGEFEFEFGELNSSILVTDFTITNLAYFDPSSIETKTIKKEVQGNNVDPKEKFDFLLMYDKTEQMDMFDRTKSSLLDIVDGVTYEYEEINEYNINDYGEGYDPLFIGIINNECTNNTKKCILIRNVQADGHSITFRLLDRINYSVIEFPNNYKCSFKLDGNNLDSSYEGTEYCRADVTDGSNLVITNKDNKLSFTLEKEVVGETTSKQFAITMNVEYDDAEYFDSISVSDISLKKPNGDVLVPNTDYIIRKDNSNNKMIAIVPMKSGDSYIVQIPDSYSDISFSEEIMWEEYDPTFNIVFPTNRNIYSEQGYTLEANIVYECVSIDSDGNNYLSECVTNSIDQSNDDDYIDLYTADYFNIIEDGDTIIIKNNKSTPIARELHITKDYLIDNTLFEFKLSIDVSNYDIENIEDVYEYITYSCIDLDGLANQCQDMNMIKSENIDTINNKYIINFYMTNMHQIWLHVRDSKISFELEELNNSPYFMIYKSGKGNYEGVTADYSFMNNGKIEFNNLALDKHRYYVNVKNSLIETKTIKKELQGDMIDQNDKFDFLLIYDNKVVNEFNGNYEYGLMDYFDSTKTEFFYKNDDEANQYEYERIDENNIGNYTVEEYDQSLVNILNNECTSYNKKCILIKNVEADGNYISFELLDGVNYSVIEFPKSYSCSFTLDGETLNSSYNGLEYCRADVTNGSNLIITNTREGITPTGKRINSMLYYIMIKMILSIMVMLFVINKKRRVFN